VYLEVAHVVGILLVTQTLLYYSSLVIYGTVDVLYSEMFLQSFLLHYFTLYFNLFTMSLASSEFGEGMEDFLNSVWEAYKDGDIELVNRHTYRYLEPPGVKSIYNMYSHMTDGVSPSLGDQPTMAVYLYLTTIIEHAGGWSKGYSVEAQEGDMGPIKAFEAKPLRDYITRNIQYVSNNFFRVYNIGVADPITDRIYLNPTNNDARLEVMKFILEQYKSPKYSKKISSSKVVGPAVNRADGILIYMTDSDSADALADDIATKFDGENMFTDALPAMVERKYAGIGRASNPPPDIKLFHGFVRPPKDAKIKLGGGNTYSFGKFYAELIWQSLNEMARFVRKDKVEEEEADERDEANFRRILKHKMELFGINPAKPSKIDPSPKQLLAWETHKYDSENLPSLKSIDLSQYRTRQGPNNESEVLGMLHEIKDVVTDLTHALAGVRSDATDGRQPTTPTYRRRPPAMRKKTGVAYNSPNDETIWV